MSSQKWSTYFKLWRKLSSYQDNQMGVKVNVPPLDVTSHGIQSITDKDIQKIEQELNKVQSEIRKAVAQNTATIQKNNQINRSLKGIINGDKPDFHYLKRVSADARQRQAEYEQIRRSFNRSHRYYEKRYGIDIGSMPKLDSHVAPTRHQIAQIRKNIQDVKQAVRKGNREDKIIIQNILDMITESLYGGDIWSKWKAEKLQTTLIQEYNTNHDEFIKKLRMQKERLDSVIERFLYIAYETVPEAQRGNTSTTEAWDIIETML